jgi:hypothetical protein
MSIWRISLGISCCWVLATGCSICQHPSYNCGPVWTQGAGPSCDLDYRAGSILNRHASGGLVADRAPEKSGLAAASVEPASGITHSALVVSQRSESSKAQTRVTSVDQPERTQKRGPAEGQPTITPLLKSSGTSTAFSSNRLPPGTVAAPPGTKEGETRVLSVTDRRLDELQRNSKPVAVQLKSASPTNEKPSVDTGGWRPVGARQDPTETANQLHEIER